MTKYILHGGAAQHPNAENDKFFREILKNAPDNPKILLVHFASSPEKDHINKERDTAQFTRVKGAGEMTLLEANKETFMEQIKKADIVYFGGGTTVKLVEEMKQFKGLKKAFEGKVVAGESAGMNFLAEYCYSKSGGGVMKCLGILPIKTIPHYTDEFKEAKKELEQIPADFETIALPEYTYIVIDGM